MRIITNFSEGKEYIEKIKKDFKFTPTNINKKTYLDIIERCLINYTPQQITDRIPENEDGFIEDIQAGSRLACTLAVMLAHGRMSHLMEAWQDLMEACCNTIYRRFPRCTNDFAVKEIMLAYKAMKGKVSKQTRQAWADKLRKIDPYKNYTIVINNKEEDNDEVRNWNIYSLAGEYLRHAEGLTDAEEYFDRHWPHQLKYFDANGMYMDPLCPILYDITSRVQMQIILGFGYDGKFAKKIDMNLKKAAMHTLFSQSSCFEMPYGGRSNQYLFNEALLAANFEYEAARYQKEGDLKTAGVFKRAAHKAIKSVERWLYDEQHARHTKNFFPVDSKFGTEYYGYYDKYMITLGSFLYIGYLFADDGIEEYPCPAETGGYVLATSESFHKLFANCQGNFIEIDTCAEFMYESTGLGRYHKSMLPSELALSMPMTQNPQYCLASLHNSLSRRNISLCTGWERKDGQVIYISELSHGLDSAVEVFAADDSCVKFTVTYSGPAINGCSAVKETYTLDRSGLRIDSELLDYPGDNVYFMIPAFLYNGKDKSDMHMRESVLKVEAMNSKYIAQTSGKLMLGDNVYANRNGEYKLCIAQMKGNKISVDLNLESKG